MKSLLRLEEAAMFGLAVFLFYTGLNFPGWLFWALLLAPDIGMLGYLVNTKTGAFTYNLLHHKAVAIIIYCLGLYYGEQVWQLTGLILFAHSSLDRVMGYGLKYADSFAHTHLGMIGKK